MKRYLTFRAILTVCILIALFYLPGWSLCLPADGVTPVNNRDYVAAVHTLIKGAKSNIRVMAYQAWHYEDYPNSDSNLFLEELIEAKKRGVDVWFFLETSNWNENLDKKNHEYARRLEKGGIKVYFDHEELTSHQKVIIIDDYATVVASINWSHFSLWLNNEVGVIVWSRPVAGAFSEYMNQLLEQAGHDPIPPTGSEKALSHEGFEMLPAQDVALLTNRNYFPALDEAFKKAEDSIQVVQRQALYYTMVPPYATDKARKPGEPISQTNALLKDLIRAKKRGVDVQVVLDAEVRKRSTGEWRVNNRNEDFAMRLLAGGVTVYYDSLTTQTHAKMVIVDDQTIVGSTNWTYNALEQGNEASVLIKSKEVADYYREYVEEIKRPGIKVEPGFDLFSLMRERKRADEEADEKR